MYIEQDGVAVPSGAARDNLKAERATALEDVGMQLFYCRQRLAADSPLQVGLARAAEIVKQMKEPK